MNRYDLFGFSDVSLEKAAAFVERAICVTMKLRDSSYRGIYYYGRIADGEYFLERNIEGGRWWKSYPNYQVTLMVCNRPDMDSIKDRLTANGPDPMFLKSIFVADRLDEVENAE